MDRRDGRAAVPAASAPGWFARRQAAAREHPMLLNQNVFLLRRTS